MRKRLSILLVMIILAGFMSSTLQLSSSASAQTITTDPNQQQQIDDLFDAMTPAERVGQLFLISFEGTDVGPDTAIYNLIHNYHIGGVVLMAANSNFLGPTNTAVNTYDLLSNLQQINGSVSDSQAAIPGNAGINSNNIPLFIAVTQEGDGYPNDQILSGLTALPNLMAIGATWSPDLAKSTAEILGRELSALGFNMLFGPSLDVLDLNYSEGNDALGTRSFGESPFWVGKLGGAYIEGIHIGSNGNMMVIATHFPGQGSSDRDPNLEVATVRKPYSALMSSDIAPFLAVTGQAANSAAVSDGLLAGHLRYEGLQGSIRNTTRPLSLDASAMEQLMAVPDFSSWRASGGLLVSDNLGSTAIRNFYDPNNISFDARLVARNAIISGMDLLYLDNFVATGDIDQTTTIIRTLEFFLQKYMEDNAFAQRVDASVRRILAKKLQMYPEFDLQVVLPNRDGLNSLGQANAITFEVAQRSITLVHPHAADYANAIPAPPGLSDRTVFFTDYRLYRQCSSCPEVEMIAPDALRRSVIKLYGPEASGDTAQYLLSNFSFNDLLSMLNGDEEAQIVEDELRAADWVVFAFMDSDPNRPATMALKELLARRADLLTNKYSIAFAFNAPNFLDATEISKLSAYFAVYSKIPSFAEVAARVLFQEIVPSGYLPISLPATGYDLLTATSPDPLQNIPLMLDSAQIANLSAGEVAPTVEGTNQPPLLASFQTGDTLPLITGQIYDRNHNIVPDGTPVKFIFNMDGDTNSVQQTETVTKDGVARAEFLIPSDGRLEISVMSGEATNSGKLVLNITKGEALVITVIVPTNTPTKTSTPSPTVQSPTPTITPTQVVLPPEPRKTTGTDWLLSMIMVWGLSFGIYTLGKTRANLRWAVRWSLLAAFGGMWAYIYLSVGIARVEQIVKLGGFPGILLGVVAGTGIGWLIGWLWYRIFTQRLR